MWRTSAALLARCVPRSSVLEQSEIVNWVDVALAILSRRGSLRQCEPQHRLARKVFRKRRIPHNMLEHHHSSLVGSLLAKHPLKLGAGGDARLHEPRLAQGPRPRRRGRLPRMTPSSPLSSPLPFMPAWPAIPTIRWTSMTLNEWSSVCTKDRATTDAVYLHGGSPTRYPQNNPNPRLCRTRGWLGTHRGLSQGDLWVCNAPCPARDRPAQESGRCTVTVRQGAS